MRIFAPRSGRRKSRRPCRRKCRGRMVRGKHLMHRRRALTGCNRMRICHRSVLMCRPGRQHTMQRNQTEQHGKTSAGRRKAAGRKLSAMPTICQRRHDKDYLMAGLMKLKVFSAGLDMPLAVLSPVGIKITKVCLRHLSGDI